MLLSVIQHDCADHADPRFDENFCSFVEQAPTLAGLAIREPQQESLGIAAALREYLKNLRLAARLRSTKLPRETSKLDCCAIREIPRGMLPTSQANGPRDVDLACGFQVRFPARNSLQDTLSSRDLLTEFF